MPVFRMTNTMVPLLLSILFIVIVVVDSQQQQQVVVEESPFAAPINYSDPLVGANLEHYVVSSNPSAITKFVCNDNGARCVYQRPSYNEDEMSFGSGQDTENEQGAVWASTSPDAVLTLGPCLDMTSASSSNTEDDNNCVVTCNANCTCAYIVEDEGKNSSTIEYCDQQVTRNPTPSPKTDPPVSTTCPEQQFHAEFCPTLMNSPLSLPEGILSNYDCFNFCGGIWIDTCDIATGTCGSTECANATAVGTLNGVVKGCTVKDHYNGNNQNNDNDQEQTPLSSKNNFSGSPRTRQYGTVIATITGVVAVATSMTVVL